MKRIILATLFLAASAVLYADVVTKTYHFTSPEITQSGEYQTISFEGCLLSATAGQPLMPYRSVALLLPPGHTAISIELIMDEETEPEGEFSIYPKQYVRPVSQGGSGIFVKDESVYSKDAAYPEKAYGRLTTQFVNGFAVALCNVTPMRYNPVTGKVSWYKSVTVRITTAENKTAESALQNLDRSGQVSRKLSGLIQNPEATERYPAKDNRSESYDLLYITPQAFAGSLKQLVDFYLPRGLHGKVATTEDICAAMPGQDNQEKIRNYIIQEYQDHGIAHVTLGGDVELVPYRGFYCSVQSSSLYEDENIPSDLYYAALDGNWNDDGDNRWGEIGEDDLLPEIGIGRMSFSNQAELDAMIHKTIQYQQNPVPGEMQNPLLVGEYLYGDPLTYGSDYLELLIGYHNDNGYETTGIPISQNTEKLYASEGSWNKSDLMALMNQGGSFIHHVGHANAFYTMTFSNSDITNANFSGLNGTDHNYALIFSHGCICGAFDESDCIGERMTAIDNLAAAVFMNSRYGWFNEGQTEGPAAHLNRELVDAFYDKNEHRLGAAYTLARISTAPWVNAPGQWEEGALRWNFYDCNLLGDAALAFWTDEPGQVSLACSDTVHCGATSLQITVAGDSSPEGLCCHAMIDSASCGMAFTDENGLAEITFTEPLSSTGEMMICVSGNNTLLSEKAVTVASAPATYFQPVWTSPYNPMAVFITSATIDDVDLQPGDEVGVFDIDPNTGNEICVGAGVLSSELTGGNYLEITASMDDGSNPDAATGFTPGNAMIFKLYDISGEDVVDAAATFPYPGYDEVFTALGNAIADLSGTLTVQYVLSLDAGWTGISSYVVPDNTSIPDLLSEVSDQVVIIQDDNAFYEPGTGTGTLLSWDYQSGYLIKLNQQAGVTIVGQLPRKNTVDLTAGWNLIPVLSMENVLLEDVFDGNLDKVELVKDAVGLNVYWPAQGVYSLQVLQSGKAYLVKTTEGFSISF